MPIYEFRCEKCQNRFERLCPIGESGAALQCPACGARALQRVMSGFATGRDKDSGGTAASTGGGCAGCAGGSCATCH